MSEWWLSRGDGKTEGPLSTQALIQGLGAGQVPKLAYVCRVGEQSWVRISQIDEIWEAVNPEQIRTNVTERPWFLSQPDSGQHRLADADADADDEHTQVLTPLPVVTPTTSSHPFVTPLPRPAMHRELLARQVPQAHAASRNVNPRVQDSGEGAQGAKVPPIRAKVPTLTGISDVPPPAATRQAGNAPKPFGDDSVRAAAAESASVRTAQATPLPRTNDGTLDSTSDPLRSAPVRPGLGAPPGLKPFAGSPPLAIAPLSHAPGATPLPNRVAGIGALKIQSPNELAALVSPIADLSAVHPESTTVPESPSVDRRKTSPDVPRATAQQGTAPGATSVGQPALLTPPPSLPRPPVPVRTTSTAAQTSAAHPGSPLGAPNAPPPPTRESRPANSRATPSMDPPGDPQLAPVKPRFPAPPVLHAGAPPPARPGAALASNPAPSLTQPRPLNFGAEVTATAEGSGNVVRTGSREASRSASPVEDPAASAGDDLYLTLDEEATRLAQRPSHMPGPAALAGDDDELTTIARTSPLAAAGDEDQTAIVSAKDLPGGGHARGAAVASPSSDSRAEDEPTVSMRAGSGAKAPAPPLGILSKPLAYPAKPETPLPATAPIVAESLVSDPADLLEEFDDDSSLPKPAPRAAAVRPNLVAASTTVGPAARLAVSVPSTPPPARRPRLPSAPSIVLKAEPLVHQEATQPAARALRRPGAVAGRIRFGTAVVLLLAVALVALATAYFLLRFK